jgi:hypothetical protein
VGKHLDWNRFMEGSTDNYGDIESLEQIKLADPRFRKDSRFPEGYPAVFLPNWYALRKRYEAILSRGGDDGGFGMVKVPVCPEERDLSDVAKCAALGIESATREYGAIDRATGQHVHLSPAMRTMRDTDPQRFAAVVAETKRLNSLGARRIAPADAIKRIA